MNVDKLEQLYPGHTFGHTWNEAGYSDVELIIDDNWTNIWIDDWMYYGDSEEDLQWMLNYIDDYFNEQNSRIM